MTGGTAILKRRNSETGLGCRYQYATNRNSERLDWSLILRPRRRKTKKKGKVESNLTL
jgi:hypothetical protein